MNGIGLLLLLAASGQVNAAHTGSEREYGWEYDTREGSDGALCYIVQVSPMQADEMQRGRLENKSDMPVELVGRATRIIFRIGTDPLPRTPSLAEISKTPRFNSAADVTAALGPGQFSDLEADSVVNVQNGSQGLPRFPQGFGAGADGNIIDQASGLDRSNPAASSQQPTRNTDPGRSLSDQFRLGAGAGKFDDSRIQGSSPERQLADPLNPSGNNQMAAPSTTPGWPGLPNTGTGSGTGSKYENTAQQQQEYASDARNRQGSQNRNTPPTNDRGLPSGYGSGSYGNENPALQNGMVGLPPQSQGNYGRNPVQNGGFSSAPDFSLGNQIPNAPYANQPNYNPAGGQGAGNYSGYPDGVNRIAANTPPTTGATGNNTVPTTPAADTTANRAGSASDASPTVSRASQPKSSEGILQVFFLLSLVVNFYLGMLIRKLLGRYRSLLSSVRGQGA